ncbi:MAG TPA: pyridoxamine 5'-phosphate oxidase family protein [Solirubrobacterales bacterium]|nr:pyridoxamine 5'-phosphate oxidase family protein [Solirubrobacterales bacterium]
MTLSNLPAWARGLIEHARVARLAFLDADDHPRVLPVTFAVDDGAIWSAIDDKPKRASEPARIRHLRRNPHAALLVDLYSDDWDELAWVQVLGSVAVVDAADAPAELDVLAAKYAQYVAERPAGPLLKLTPARALWWRARGD